MPRYTPPEVAEAQVYKGRGMTFHRATPDVALYIDGEYIGTYLSAAKARVAGSKIVDQWEREKIAGGQA
jgi:hypothetical protein